MNPRALEDLIAEIPRLARRMRLEAGRGPSAAELAGYLHLPLAEVRQILARAKSLAAATRNDGGKAGGAAVPGGLSEALTAEEERVLCRRFAIGRAPGQSAARPLDAATQADLRALADKVLAGLTPREARVLRTRFGIGMNTDRALEEVGRKFAVTRERIRRIEAKALRKLAQKEPEDT